MVLKKITLQGVQPKGMQRWFCKDCHRPFTPERAKTKLSRYDLEVHQKTVMLYFDQGASYRAVARKLRRLGLKSVEACQNIGFYLQGPLGGEPGT